MPRNIYDIQKKLHKIKGAEIEAREWRASIVLEGKTDTWDKYIKAGYIAAQKWYKGVVNNIEVEGIKKQTISSPAISDRTLQGKSFDVVVIGGGIIGVSILRELSRYKLNVALLEKEEDLTRHASSRNDGIIHPGFAASPGSKKAFYNVRGNSAYDQASRELGFEIRQIGTLVLYGNPFAKVVTPLLSDRAKRNGVDGYMYLNKEEVKAREPFITAKQHGAFFLPSTRIVSPYNVALAYAENAIYNGAQVFLNTIVEGFERRIGNITAIKTNRGTIKAGVVVNSAGVWSDRVAEMADDRFFTIHGRKGVDCVLDVHTGQYQTSVLAMLNLVQIKSETKGGGLVPTIEGNLIVGPTAEEIPYREDYSTNLADLDKLLKHIALNTKISAKDVIHYFAGIRACTFKEDFIIEASDYVGNLVHVAGIQSPGIASAPAIAIDTSKICVDILSRSIKVVPNEKFNPVREKRPLLKSLSLEARAELIRKNPSYGRIVCRCEEISEGEIYDALRSPISVTSTDGVKRRTRTGMGRCHGGYCTPRILEIMSEELNIPITEINKKGKDSEYLLFPTKGNVDYSDKRVRELSGEEQENV